MKYAFLAAVFLLAAGSASAGEAPLPVKVRAACAAEIEKLCSNAHDASQALDCLSKSDKVTDHNCRNALQGVGVTPRAGAQTTKGNAPEATPASR